MRRGWLRRNRLTTTPPAHDSSVRVGAPGRTRLPTPPPAHDSCVREGGGFHFYSSLLLLQALHTPLSQRAKSKSSPISLVKSLSRGLGHKTRRPPGRLCRALRIPVFLALLLLGSRSCLHRRVSYPTRAPRQHRSPDQTGKESEKATGK